MESKIADTLNALWDSDRADLATRKSTHSDMLNTLRDGDGFEGCTSLESIISDTLHRSRDNKICDRYTVDI